MFQLFGDIVACSSVVGVISLRIMRSTCSLCSGRNLTEINGKDLLLLLRPGEKKKFTLHCLKMRQDYSAISE